MQHLRVRLLGLLPGCRQMSCGMLAAYSYFSKDLPRRCGPGNLAQRRARREVPEKRHFMLFSTMFLYALCMSLRLCAGWGSVGEVDAASFRAGLVEGLTPCAVIGNAGSSQQVKSSPNLKLPLHRTVRKLPALSRCGEAEQQASWPQPQLLVFAYGCRRERPGLVPTCASSSLFHVVR